MRFRKKPVIIEAIRWDGSNKNELLNFANTGPAPMWGDDFKIGGTKVYINTLEGEMIANTGDWIIRGVNGEFYPCKPDIFEKTYEKAETKFTVDAATKVDE